MRGNIAGSKDSVTISIKLISETSTVDEPSTAWELRGRGHHQGFKEGLQRAEKEKEPERFTRTRRMRQGHHTRPGGRSF